VVVEDVRSDGYVLDRDRLFVLGNYVLVVRCHGCEEVCSGGVVGGWWKQVDVDYLTTDAELLFVRDA